MGSTFRYIDLFNDKRLFFIVLGSLLIFIPIPFLGAVGWAWVFGLFDILGFEYTDNRAGTQAYRTIQTMFMIFSLLVVYLLQHNVNIVIACLLMWWCFVCDLVYYFGLTYKVGNVTWFKGCLPMLFSKHILRCNYASPVVIFIFFALSIAVSFYITTYCERFF